MFSVNPKWYRVYNDTSEYFILAKSQLQASNAVCDHIKGGAKFNVEYATMSAVRANVDEIVGKFDVEETLNELYYQENIPERWYLVSYEFRGNIYTDSVLADSENSAYKCFVERINQQDNYILVDIHAATKREMIDHLEDLGYLGEMDEFDYMVLLNDSRFKE